MSELAALRQAATELQQVALTDIRRHYGINGQQPLPYHDERHTTDVIDAVIALSAHAKLDQRSVLLLPIAAAFHDIEHGLVGHQNELAQHRHHAPSMQELLCSTR